MLDDILYRKSRAGLATSQKIYTRNGRYTIIMNDDIRYHTKQPPIMNVFVRYVRAMRLYCKVHGAYTISKVYAIVKNAEKELTSAGYAAIYCNGTYYLCVKDER